MLRGAMKSHQMDALLARLHFASVLAAEGDLPFQWPLAAGHSRVQSPELEEAHISVLAPK
jgi:hypothetical protein